MRTLGIVIGLSILCLSGRQIAAQVLVPGAGQKIDKVGDDFEGENWEYVFNFPKSSEEQDGNVRVPGGYSTNGRWMESAKRGQPDVVRVMDTPPGGVPGSAKSLLLASRVTGIPGRPSGKMQQDDFLVNLKRRIKGHLPVSWGPSCVVRVYLPPYEEWENRTGTSFGIRADVKGSKGWSGTKEDYWPGFFIWFRSEHDRRHKQDGAHLLVRSGSRGQDLRGPEIKQTGWWTFGMSFSPDGRVHYFAKPGVENLTAADHITSQSPYGFRCQEFHTFFFNVANGDDGRNWSTHWIIDDPAIYIANPPKRTARRN